MLKKYIECGKIVSTHGIKGELKIQPWTDDIDYLLNFKLFYYGNNTQLEVISSRIHKGMLLLTVKGIESVESANNYRGYVLSFNREDDSEDAIFLVDYLGVTVTDADTDQDYGVITDIMQTGANDVYLLKDSKGVERLIPDIPDVIIEANIAEGTMKIRPLKGLFDDED